MYLQLYRAGVCLLTLNFALNAVYAESFAPKPTTHAEAIYRRILEAHWNAETGLFASFPDSQDAQLAQQASTYDQAAMGLLMIAVRERSRAENLLDFFLKTWEASPHGFANFYNVDYVIPGIEKTIHLGPNAWMGLFAARYANRWKDERALHLANAIAWWAMNSLPHQEGAVAMGATDTPGGAPWTKVYSTENNISYLAFLNELLRSTALEAEQARTRLSTPRSRATRMLRTAPGSSCTSATLSPKLPGLGREHGMFG